MQSSVPLDFLGNLKRTHTCGQLRASDAGSRALLMGWVHRRRDLGGVIFIHLRDRDGVSQAVFHTDSDPAVHAKAELLRSEYVVAVEGLVALRTPDTINATIPTGEVEVVAEKIWILNESRTPPFPMEDTVDVSEDARLKYRYVDLRRPRMQRNIILRSKISFAVREVLYSQGFLEIETLIKRVCEVAGYDVPTPFPRLTYAEAMRSYGSDKPDRRIPAMHPVEDLLPDLTAHGLPLMAIHIPNTGALSRKERDELKAF